MKAKSLLDQWVDLKEDFPRHIVLIQCGVFYETYQEDAEFLSEISKIKTYLRGPCNVAGFPIQSIEKFKKNIEELAIQILPTMTDNTKHSHRHTPHPNAGRRHVR